MGIEIRTLEDREAWLKWREDDITASNGACLFGADIHPYTSAYQLWAEKSGLWKPQPMDAKLARRGHYVEKMAPELLSEEHPDWHVVPNPYYYRDVEARIGATPDLWARRPDIAGAGIIDVKSVGAQTFRRWKDRDTGDTELPVWMAIQVNIQAALVAAYWEGDPLTWGAVAAVTIGDAGLDIELLIVTILPGMMDNFRGLAKDFWRRVEAREPYPIDWGKDAETILGMYRDDDGSIIDLSEDEALADTLAQREGYKQIEREGAEAEKSRKLLDAMIIDKLGNAMTARTKQGLIKAPTVRVKEAVRKAYTFRRITVTGYEARDTGTSHSDELAQ
jgi:predicted phage-related endonuclease